MKFSAIEFIEKKRDFGIHTEEEFKAFISGLMDGSIPGYQLAAWLMAAKLNGLTDDEIVYLTKALAHSGKMIKFSGSSRIVDKHSTGGVGDKTTLILIPTVAACGAKISKLSGRGLGITGGTVDKLESIPGMNMHLTEQEIIRQVNEINCAVSGHSDELVPAEDIFYKMRDVTGTVPSIPLIASSILSKKLAGGASGYVFDVKCGSGTFMKSEIKAGELAQKLTDIACALGKRAMAIVSDMEQPLGEWVGNSAEVYEAIEVLKGRGPADTKELCIELGASMLLMSGATDAQNPDGCAKCKKMCLDAIDGGAALDKFTQLIKRQGGDASIISNSAEMLLNAKNIYEIKADMDGVVSRADAGLIGKGARALGCGRFKCEDEIDHSAAICICRKTGDRVKKGDTLAKIYYNNEEKLKDALPYLKKSFEFSGTAKKRRLIINTYCKA